MASVLEISGSEVHCTNRARKPAKSRPKIERKSRPGGSHRIAATVSDMRVLIVEDEHGLAEAVQIGLAREGYAADVALSRAEAERKLAVSPYDLLLLDVTLPDGNGLDLAAAVRSGECESLSGRDVRILMLTARGGLAERVRGLDAGADDYLVKPFALLELTARVRALLRREVSASSTVLRAGELSLDTARQLVHRGERELSLTLKEFAVLRYLMSRPGHVVSSEELLEHVWDENADPFTQTVRVTVGTLRRKLTVDGEEGAPGDRHRPGLPAARRASPGKCLRCVRAGATCLTGCRPGPGPCAFGWRSPTPHCCSPSPPCS